MRSSVIQKYKNKYTRELTRLLLVRMPPRNNRCFGLTGNFLPVIVLTRSNRKFRKLRGWFYTKYAVTNKYAKLSERAELHQVDSKLIDRLRYRLFTTKVRELPLRGVNVDDGAFYYVTVIDDVVTNLYVFYLNRKRDAMLRAFEDDVRVKEFVFKRFGKLIINYVTSDHRVSTFFMGI